MLPLLLRSERNHPQVVSGLWVSSNFFPVPGITPTLGRRIEKVAATCGYQVGRRQNASLAPSQSVARARSAGPFVTDRWRTKKGSRCAAQDIRVPGNQRNGGCDASWRALTLRNLSDTCATGAAAHNGRLRVQLPGSRMLEARSIRAQRQVLGSTKCSSASSFNKHL